LQDVSYIISLEHLRVTWTQKRNVMFFAMFAFEHGVQQPLPYPA
jgi:hypothetical protein